MNPVQIAILALAILGIADSAHLFYEHLGHDVICIGSGCSIVDESIYSEVFGIPTSVMGLVGYVIIFALSWAGFRLGTPAREWVHAAIYGFALVGVLYSGYLTYLELFVIHAICTWRVVSAVIITTIFVLAVIGLRRGLRLSPQATP
jgi:uncharacterized membrane protein